MIATLRRRLVYVLARLIRHASQLTLRLEHAMSYAFEFYRTANSPVKLHLGCGDHILASWFNTDLNPLFEAVEPLDVTLPFDIPSGSVDLIFTEHLIEHLPYSDGRHMILECFRVLRVGGILRVATPDILFLIDLMTNRSELNRSYVEWATRTFLADAPHASSTFVVNNFFRDWGHQFIYDEDTLSGLLTEAGFSDITRVDLEVSNHEHLNGLENVGRMPDGFLKLETIVLEATR